MPFQPFSIDRTFPLHRREVLATVLVLAALIVPWMSPLHPAPLADWFTDTLTLVGIALAALIPLSSTQDRHNTRVMNLGWAMVILLGVLTLIHRPPYQVQVWHPVGAVLAMVLLASVVRDLISTPEARLRFLDALAWALLISGVVQATIGLLQYLGLANYAGFWLVHNPGLPTSTVMGNIAQRNVFAHVLALGAVSACWLYSRGRLGLPLAGALVALIALIQAWCGARLVLAYGAGLIVLALWWWLRARQDEAVRRFCQAAWLAGALMLGMQWAGAWIAELLLTYFGLGAKPDSGFARLLDVVPTQRRWSEWSKALEGFYQNPIFGLGWGGLAANSAYLEAFGTSIKSADNTLCLHAHNLVIQLLTETGLVGTTLILGGIAWCLWPCVRHARVDSVFLLGLAMVTLTHSQFEYPMWYLTGLATFTVVLACASPEPVSGALLRPVFRRFAATVAALGLLLHAGFGWFSFHAIVVGFSNSPASWDKPLADKIYKMQFHPLRDFDAELVMAIHVMPYGEPMKAKRQLLERQASYRPYGPILFKVAIMRALDGETAKALEATDMLIAGFPDMVLPFLQFSQAIPEPAIRPVQERMLKALQAAEQARQQQAGSAPAAAEPPQSK